MIKYINLFLAHCFRGIQILFIVLFCLAVFHGDTDLIPYDGFMFYFIATIGASAVCGVIYQYHYNRFIDIDIEESMSAPIKEFD